MKHHKQALQQLSSYIWILAGGLYIYSLVFALINHRSLFGVTAKNIYRFLSYGSTTFSITNWTIKPDVLIQWPTWFLLKFLPKEHSFIYSLYTLEATYLLLGLLTLGTLFWVYKRSDKKEFAIPPLIVFALVLQGSLLISPATLVPIMFFTLAFYALILRNDNDPALAVLVTLISFILVWGNYSISPALLLMAYVSWQQKNTNGTKINKIIAWMMLLFALFGLFKFIYVNDPNLFDDSSFNYFNMQWEFIISGLFYLIPLFVFSKKPATSNNGALLQVYLLITTMVLLVFNAAQHELRSTLSHYSIISPLILFIVSFIILSIEDKEITSTRSILLIILTAIAALLCVNLPEISNLRFNLSNAINDTKPNSPIMLLTLLILFIIQFLYLTKTKFKKHYTLWFIGGAGFFSGLVGIVSTAFSRTDIIGGDTEQHYFMKLAFLFAVVSWITVHQKMPVKSKDSPWNYVVKAAPGLIILWSLTGIYDLENWKKGVEQFLAQKPSGNGCLLITSGQEQADLTSLGISSEHAPYLAMLMNGDWSIKRIIFYKDMTNPENNPCVLKRWTSGVSYLGTNTWSGAPAPWRVVPLMDKRFDFSFFLDSQN